MARSNTTMRHERESYVDPVVEAYMDGIDRSLLRRNLALTPHERMVRFVEHMKLLDELRSAGRKMRKENG